MTAPVHVHRHARRKKTTKPRALTRPLYPGINRVKDWDFDGEDVNLLDAEGETIDVLHADSLVDEWLLEATEKGWVSYSVHDTYTKIDGEEAKVYNEDDELIDVIDVDSLVAEWLMERGWKPPK